MNGKDRPRVAVIIPALDEERAIAGLVSAVPADLEADIIVVDNGSKDGTAQAAEQAGAHVVLQAQRGYGTACRAGLDAAATADIVVFMDGDFSDDPNEIPKVLDPVLRGEADLVLGRRRPCEAGIMPRHQELGNRVIAAAIGLIYGVRLSDIGSLRAIRRQALADLDMSHPTYGWPVEMLVKAARAGYRIREVPVVYRRRIGHSKVGGTVKGSVLAAYHMLAMVLRYSGRGNPRLRQTFGDKD